MFLRRCVCYILKSISEGDHIKVTASKYPFPTVCADKQSTDWFHAISRTLKWNERERQKSFVVVEEGPAKPKKRKEQAESGEVLRKNGIKEEEENLSDEEDEVSDEEEEKFDIDDSSPEATGKGPSPTEQTSREKARAEQDAARHAAVALSKGVPALLRRRSRSRSRGGIDSPDRFASAHPRPPRLSPRHVSFAGSVVNGNSDAEPEPEPTLLVTSSSQESIGIQHDAFNGDRDHIHSPQLLSGGRSRIPKDRDVDAESMKTPTAADMLHGLGVKRGHSRTSSRETGGCIRRAFAVWGQDESDSNASDGDA